MDTLSSMKAKREGIKTVEIVHATGGRHPLIVVEDINEPLSLFTLYMSNHLVKTIVKFMHLNRIEDPKDLIGTFLELDEPGYHSKVGFYAQWRLIKGGTK